MKKNVATSFLAEGQLLLVVDNFMISKNDQAIQDLLASDLEAAYHLLVGSYAGFVLNSCINQVPRKEDAEDLTQEVFIAAHQGLSDFEGRSKISTWLYAIIINKCNEFHRKQNRHKRKGVEKSLDDESASWNSYPSINFEHPGVQLERKEHTEILFHAISCLPENQRVAYTLNKIDGQSYAETAEIMKQSVSAIESLIFRANRNLRNLLSDYYQKNFKE